MIHASFDTNSGGVPQSLHSSKHSIDLKSSPLTDSNDMDPQELQILDGDSSNTSSNSSSNGDEIFNHIIHQFDGKLDLAHIDTYSDDFVVDLNEALSQNSPISMLPNSNINPTGQEYGNYLAIDLGGSTLRISVIQLLPPTQDSSDEDRSNRVNIVNGKKWIMGNNEKVIDINFFKYMSSKIIECINDQDVISITDDVINVGITWSFPLNQTSHNSGNIIHVGKGWSISKECYNKDLKFLLQDTMKDQYNLNLDVKVIINDSLAVYVAGKFLSSELKLAMVLGTGLNTCCSIKTSSKVHASKILQDEPAMLFNCETSLFGSNLFNLSTEFDYLIDKRFSMFERTFKSHMTTDQYSDFVFQPFELMTSGRYLPELTRLAIIKLLNHHELFEGFDIPQTSKLFISYDGFSNELLCFISENDDLELISSEFNKEYQLECNIHDIQKIKQLVDSIITRASYIVTISIIGFIKLLKQHNEGEFINNHLIIGYVGSILVYFKKYRNLIMDFINTNDYIMDMKLKVELMPIDDSSIVGAAVGAAFYNEH